MNTFYQLWGVTTPEQAKAKIESQRIKNDNPQNLEEQALALAGKDIYETLIKEYTEKQWGRPCTELPAFIIKRLPFRFRFDNNYFNDRWQGVPTSGYTAMVAKMLHGIEVRTDTIFVKDAIKAKHIIYTGAIDEYFDYQLGTLEYRSVQFEKETLDCENFQGNVAVNYTSHEETFTRIIEHKHFFNDSSLGKTVITREYPAIWQKGDEPYYPVNNEQNDLLYARYTELAKNEPNVTFGGRLGLYRYFDMDKTIAAALDAVKSELRKG
jgi:UDP-galactopyranose mutase